MTGVLVETDLIVAYLLAPSGTTPLLRRLLITTICHTTFIQAAEIYGTARTPEELRDVERALFGLKILGASGRYAATIGRVRSSNGDPNDYRTAIVGAMAIESRMPIVTDRYMARYEGMDGVRLLRASELAAADDVTLAGLLSF